MNVMVFIIAGVAIAVFHVIVWLFLTIYDPEDKDGRMQLVIRAVPYTVIVVLGLIVIGLVFGRSGDNDIEVPEPPVNTIVPSGQDSSFFAYLSDDQLIREIGNDLSRDSIRRAASAMQFLDKYSLRDQECDHIFGFCIANRQLDYADSVAELYQAPSRRVDAKEEVQRERLKQTR